MVVLRVRSLHSLTKSFETFPQKPGEASCSRGKAGRGQAPARLLSLHLAGRQPYGIVHFCCGLLLT